MKLTCASVALFAVLTACAPEPLQQPECSDIHILVGRGSKEPQGMGGTGKLAKAIQAQMKGVTTEAVIYPAELSPYPPSSSAGAKAVVKQVTAYVKACPKSKLILMGYSQGADIVGSAMCGHGLKGAKKMSLEVGKNIKAAVMFGDPRYSPKKSWDAGTAKQSGKGGMIKPLMTSCPGYEGRIISFCDTGDTFCDSGRGQDGSKIHGGYLKKYTKDATSFIMSKVK